MGEGRPSGPNMFHIWLALNELKPDASTRLRDPPQYMGQLVSSVWSNYIQNSWTYNKSQKFLGLNVLSYLVTT